MKRGLALLLALVMALSMLPISAFAEEALTLEEILEETIPEETIPEETIPEETIPEETIPEETVPEETIPEETIPEETIPEETIPEETIPEETIPEETIPEETVPEETLPEETLPEETLPEETIPEETIPEETIPEETISEETVPEETVSEVTVPKKNEATGAVIDSGTCGDDLTWELTSDYTLTISGTGAMPNFTSNEDQPWYAYREDVEVIVVEEGVTSIGEFAFMGFIRVDTVTLPEGVTTIGKSAFNEGYCLRVLTLPSTLKTVCEKAFNSCVGLHHVLFRGTEEQWNAVTVKTSNTLLNIRLKHYNATGEEVTIQWDGTACTGYCTVCQQEQDFGPTTMGACKVIIEEGPFYYTGSKIRPKVTVYFGHDVILKEGVDYELLYRFNKEPGRGRIDVNGRKNFYLAQDCFFFPILMKPVENLRVISLGKDSVTVAFNKVAGADEYRVRIKKSDYDDTTKTKYTFDDLTWGKTYTVQVTPRSWDGYEWFSGETAELTVRPSVDIGDCSESIEYTSAIYDGTEKTPAVTVKTSSKGSELVEGVDYEVSYENNTEIGKATAIITGLTKYSGTVEKSFKILPDQVQNLNVEMLSGSSVNISFDPVPGATEYWIYRNGEVAKKITETSYTMTGLSAGKTYKFSVKANTRVYSENYTGAASETVSVKPIYHLEDCSVAVKYATKGYTGKSVTNTFTIKNPDGKTLKQDEDYKVTYENNKNIGTATATITGKGKYAGTLTATFDIVPPKMGKIKAVAKQHVAGTAIEMTFKNVSQAEWFAIYLNGELYNTTGELGHSTGYLEPGTYSVTVSAATTIDGKDYIGAPSDPVKVTVRKTLQHCFAELPQTEYVYTGKSIKADVVVYGYSNEVLTEGVDYTLSYKNNKNSGLATVEINGKGGYNGSLKCNYFIYPAAVKNLKVSSTTKSSVKLSWSKTSSAKQYEVYEVLLDGEGNVQEYVYLGKTTSSSYTVKNLELGQIHYYLVAAVKNVTYTVDGYKETVPLYNASELIAAWPGTGIGGYKATLEYTEKIYTGEEFKPAVTVKTSSKSSATTLTQGVDYIVTYENNVGPGKAKVIIRGIGGYTGTITKTFTIAPPKVENVTAVAASNTSIEVSFDAAPGATSYWVYVNGERKAKITDTSCVISGLKKGKTYKITVKAVATVDGTSYTSDYTDAVSCKTVFVPAE